MYNVVNKNDQLYNWLNNMHEYAYKLYLKGFHAHPLRPNCSISASNIMEFESLTVKI